MTVLIAGAGIGGLTLALSLHQIGVPCRVFESVDELRPLGVGINVQPHAIRELEALNLLPDLDSIGLRTAALGYFSTHGKEIWREPRGIEAGYRWPQFSIHRGHLQMMLFEVARTRLGGDAIRTGAAVREWRGLGDGVEVTLSTGETVAGSLLIAADGIHSTARAGLYPDEGLPLWNRVLMWRGTTWAPDFLGGRTMAMIGCKARKFVCYPIREDVDRVLINWIADLMYPPDHHWAREDWNRPGRAEDLLPHFGGWSFDWLDVPAVIRGSEAIFEWPMVDRDPLPKWTHGPMTLMGDAAHPMYPIGSNGASQAILDARVLAREIRDHGAVPRALEAYEAERRPKTSAIVLANRGDGPDKVLDVVEDRAPDGFERLEDVISAAELEEIAAEYKATAGMDVEALNAAPGVLG
ncbi:MAG: flavin-dependent oxidoreductase [Pseudomonadota bacterium]